MPDLNAGYPDIGIKVEKSMDFTGNMPVVKKRPLRIKRPRRSFVLPDGLGFEIGYSQSSFCNNSTSNIAIGSLTAGLLFNMELGEHFAIQPGLRYLTKGNKLESNLDVETNEKLSLHYLELPANLIWKPGKVGNARIMIGGGPYIAYLAGSKERFQTPALSDGGDVLPSAPQYSEKNINKTEWGLDGFIGVQSPDGFFIKAGTEFGMMDLNKNSTGSGYGSNYSMMVTVGYIIGGK